MLLAVGEAHGNGVSDKSPTPEVSNVLGDDFRGRRFDPFRVGKPIVVGFLSVGFAHG